MTQFDLMIREDLACRMQEVSRGPRLSRSNVEDPVIGRLGFERQVNRSRDIAYVHRVVFLVASLGHDPFLAAPGLFDELAIEGQRAVTRLFPRSINRQITRRKKFDAVVFTLITAGGFAAELNH